MSGLRMLIIAAAALQHGLTIVSRDMSGYERGA
jgi:predicted nucleic acid-binding protein